MEIRQRKGGSAIAICGTISMFNPLKGQIYWLISGTSNYIDFRLDQSSSESWGELEVTIIEIC